ncbi:MAG TPA: hypothetical protein PKY12_15835, partial [Catalimonadaceae bacterium]|nr:hypothetical protein [Catalimonadaceae bacterium]
MEIKNHLVKFISWLFLAVFEIKNIGFAAGFDGYFQAPKPASGIGCFYLGRKPSTAWKQGGLLQKAKCAFLIVGWPDLKSGDSQRL